MPTATGHQASAGFKKEAAAWGTTEIQLSAGDKLPLKGTTLDQVKTVAPRAVLDGQGGESFHDVYRLTAGNDLVCYGYYDNNALLSLMICALGFSHKNNSPQNPTGSVYTHLVELAKELDLEAWKTWEEDASPSGNKVRFGTVCTNPQVSIWEFLSSKIESMTIRGSASSDKPIEITFNMIARSRDRSSGTNTDASTWTGNILQPILFNDLVVRMRPVDEYTITSANDIIQFVEDPSGSPVAVDSHVADGTYSGAEYAALRAKAFNDDGSSTFTMEGVYHHETRKFEFRNISSSKVFNIDVSDSDSQQASNTIGFPSDPTAALSITGQVGGQFDNADLDSNDQVSISDFEIVVKNNLEDTHQTTGTGLYIEEPLRKAPFAVSFTATFPRYQNDTFLKHVDYDTVMCADWRFTGATISGGEGFEFNLLIPQFKFTSVPAPIRDTGLVPQTLNAVVSKPLLDKLPGWDENGYTSDSEIDKFLITTVLAGSERDVFAFTAYKSKIYAGLAGSDAVLAEYDPATDTWTDPFLNITGYGSITGLAVANGKLYIAALNDASDEAHIFSWDGTTAGASIAFSDLTDEETFATQIVRRLMYSNVAGLLLLSLDNGDIYSSSDGSTWTSRENSSLSDCPALTEGNYEGTPTIFAGGAEQGAAGDSYMLQSTDGINWSAHQGGTISGAEAIISLLVKDGYLYIAVLDSDGNAIFRNSSIQLLSTVVTDAQIPYASGVHPTNMIEYKGLIYFVTADGRLYSNDGHNQGSTILRKTLTGETFNTLNGYPLFVVDDKLWIGTTDDGQVDGKVMVVRPLQAIQIEVQNGLSTNPGV